MLLQCVVDSMSTQKVLGFNDLLGKLYTRSTRTVQRLHLQASQHAGKIEDRGKSHFMEDVVLGPNGDKNLEDTKGWPHRVEFFRSPNPRTFGNGVRLPFPNPKKKHTKLIDPLIRPYTCLDFIVRGNLVFCCLCCLITPTLGQRKYPTRNAKIHAAAVRTPFVSPWDWRVDGGILSMASATLRHWTLVLSPS